MTEPVVLFPGGVRLRCPAEPPCSSCAYYDDERGFCSFYGHPVILGEDGACTHYEP